MYVGIHPPHAAFGNSTATYSTVTTILPLQLRLLQADYLSTILEIQYDNSMVIILRNSTDAFDDSECVDAVQ